MNKIWNTIDPYEYYKVFSPKILEKYTFNRINSIVRKYNIIIINLGLNPIW